MKLGQATSGEFVVANVDMLVGYEFTTDTYLGTYSDPVIFLDVKVHSVEYIALPGLEPLDLTKYLSEEVINNLIDDIKDLYIHGKIYLEE